MTSPPTSSTPSTADQRRSWGSWAIILLSFLVTLIALAFVASNQRFRAAQIETQLQSLQLELLERSLASESVINDETVAMLQRAEIGQSLSALAELKGVSPDGTPISAITLWSDVNAAGHLILPREMVANVLAARIEVFAQLEGTALEQKLTVSQADHRRVLGFRLDESGGRAVSLRLVFQSTEDGSTPITLTGNLER